MFFLKVIRYNYIYLHTDRWRQDKHRWRNNGTKKLPTLIPVFTKYYHVLLTDYGVTTQFQRHAYQPLDVSANKIIIHYSGDDTLSKPVETQKSGVSRYVNVRDLFDVFLNKVKILLFYVRCKPGIEILLYFNVVGMCFNYLSNQQSITSHTWCVWPNNIQAPPPKFWTKWKSLVWCTNTCNMNVKLTLLLDCGFICHSKETKFLHTCF